MLFPDWLGTFCYTVNISRWLGYFPMGLGKKPWSLRACLELSFCMKKWLTFSSKKVNSLFEFTKKRILIPDVRVFILPNKSNDILSFNQTRNGGVTYIWIWIVDKGIPHASSYAKHVLSVSRRKYKF